jgi:TIR domain
MPSEVLAVTVSAQPHRVFISYSHDSPEHKDKVLDLSDRLRRDGIDCRLDQYEQAPPEGWPRWTEKKIRDADHVLMIRTEAYYRRVMGEEKPDLGLGVRWEGHMIQQHLYNAETVNRKFIPVLLTIGDEKHIPTPIQSRAGQ